MHIFNRLLSYGESITKYDYAPAFSQNFFSRLTPTQLKIAAVASLALALIAAIYVSYRCFCAHKDPTPDLAHSPNFTKKSSGNSSSDSSPPSYQKDSSPGLSKKWSGQQDQEILDDSKQFDDPKQPGTNPGNDQVPYDYSAYNFDSPPTTKKKIDDDVNPYNKIQLHNLNLQDYVDDDAFASVLAQLAADEASAKSQLSLKPSSPVLPKPFTGQQLFGGNPGIPPQGIPQINPFNQAPLVAPGFQHGAGVVDPFNQGQGAKVDPYKSPPSSPKFVHKPHVHQEPVIDDILSPFSCY